MKMSDKGLKMLMAFEGCKLKAYKVHPGEVYYTIGVGHYGKDVKPDMTITKEEALRLLSKDVEHFERHVSAFNSRYNFTQTEYDALVSFAFNLGSINQLTANGTRSKDVIANKMLLYVKSGGKTLKGLVTRRQKEHDLFTKGIYPV